MAAIERGDDAVIGAVLRGPAFLTGLSEAELAVRQSTWRRIRFPEEFNRENRLKKAMEATEAAGRSFLTFVKSVADGEAARLADAAQQRARAAEAVTP